MRILWWVLLDVEWISCDTAGQDFSVVFCSHLCSYHFLLQRSCFFEWNSVGNMLAGWHITGLSGVAAVNCSQWLLCTNLTLELTEVCHWCVLPFLWVRGSYIYFTQSDSFFPVCILMKLRLKVNKRPDYRNACHLRTNSQCGWRISSKIVFEKKLLRKLVSLLSLIA